MHTKNMNLKFTLQITGISTGYFITVMSIADVTLKVTIGLITLYLLYKKWKKEK